MATDVTRTICFGNQNKRIKDIFTNVLKGHIAVVKPILIKKTGKLIDIEARDFLKRITRLQTWYWTRCWFS